MTHQPEPPRKIHADRLADAFRTEQRKEQVDDLPRHPAARPDPVSFPTPGVTVDR